MTALSELTDDIVRSMAVGATFSDFVSFYFDVCLYTFMNIHLSTFVYTQGRMEQLNKYVQK